MSLIDFFKAIGHLFEKAFSFAQSKGLNDKLIQAGLDLVQEIATNGTMTNDMKREFVVSELVKQFNVPESIARFAVETAVQIYKSHQQS